VAPELRDARDYNDATPWDVVLREGAKLGAPKLRTARLEVAELLEPGRKPPQMEELLAAAKADQEKQSARCAEMERAQMAKPQAESMPGDRGYVSSDPALYRGWVLHSPKAKATLLSLLDPELSRTLTLTQPGKGQTLRKLCTELTPGVFAFRLFESLGTRILAELSAIETWAAKTGWSLKRPNSMNRYGVVLADVGLGPLMKVVNDVVVAPLVEALWPDVAAHLPNLHSFTVRYRGNEDRSLDTHVDSSDVTLNVCLGGDFTGGGVYFHSRRDDNDDPMTTPHPADCKYCLATHPHEPGMAIIHLGNHIHGAHNIDAGERTNLILWCRRPIQTLEVEEELEEID